MKQPFHIPLAMGLVGDKGSLPLYLAEGVAKGEHHCVLELTHPQQTFIFTKVKEPPVPSLLRNFSAPVKLNFDYQPEELLRLTRLDEDGFCRWDACQQLGMAAVKRLVPRPECGTDLLLVDALRHLLEDEHLDPAMVALMLDIPAESYIGDQFDTVDVDAIHEARHQVRLNIAVELAPLLLKVFQRCRTALDGLPAIDGSSIGHRSLLNRCLSYLMLIDDPQYQALCLEQFEANRNMTEVLAALTALVHCPFAEVQKTKHKALASFYERWRDEPLVVNQWLAVQASSPLPGTLLEVQSLLHGPAYDSKNPNKIRSLIGVFAGQNPVNFHALDGEGYKLLADQIIALNQLNPQIAARLVTPLSKWRRFGANRQQLMRAQLKRIAAVEKLSKDVFEVVGKSL